MTKKEILQTFEDINLVYNDCTRYDTLKRMLDELQEPCEDCVYSTSEGCQYDDITETIPPFDDCISRQAVLDGLASIAKAKAKSDAQKSLMGRIMFFTEQLPSVTPQQRTGRWILTDDDFVYCSECEDSYYPRPIDASWYYCPHCGAKMEVEE